MTERVVRVTLRTDRVTDVVVPLGCEFVPSLARAFLIKGLDGKQYFWPWDMISSVEVFDR